MDDQKCANETKVFDAGITMVDVLQEEQDLEDDAEAVLGAGDDSSCTYDKGYMKRQPLYACRTCIRFGSKSSAGICLGCSYHCHEGHDLIELYTKRYFRCDCGNSKYPEMNSCKLIKNKTTENADNHYNHNFQGNYCTCSRPYPDPEDHVEDQMIQCITCEDWYHGRHLNVSALPSEDEFSEMICRSCVMKMPFLKYYLGLAVTPVNHEDSMENINVTPTKENSDVSLENCGSNSTEKFVPPNAETKENDETNNDVCKLKQLKELQQSDGAIFFNDSWRKELCCCPSCKELYAQLMVSYLLDAEDTVAFYESQGRAKRHAQMGVQREIDALSSLDRITRTEVVHEYNNLSTALRDYLKKFAENGKVVRDEDIREFFSELSAKKKQKKDEFQFFCK